MSELRRREKRAFDIARRIGRPEPVKMKTFTPVNKELPELESYSGIFPNSYWNLWETRRPGACSDPRSWIDSKKFSDLCTSSGMKDSSHLENLTRGIEEGFRIGCTGEGRLSTVGRNSDTASEYGNRVADSLLTWIKEGICFGPLKKEELPWKDVSISPITVRIKPNGKARIIIDMSYPHDRKLKRGQGRPMSVNSSINIDEFRTTMGTTKDWLKCLFWAGIGAKMSKADLVSAYKHYLVNPEDWKLQTIEFGGRYFIESQLVFGTRSSPALYNRPAMAITEASRRTSGLNPRCQVQCLDDVITAVPAREEELGRKFDSHYSRHYEYLGGKLASSDDPEKSFSSATKGICLGVEYDTSRWRWNIPEIKKKLVLLDLYTVLESDLASNGLLLSLNGRLNHYAPLVVGGKWWRTPLLKLQDSEASKSIKVQITNEAKQCARYWIAIINRLRVSDLPIVDVRGGFPASANRVFSDASGCQILSSSLHGAASWSPTGHWSRYRWPGTYSWRYQFGQCLSLLEGIGVMLALLLSVHVFGCCPVSVPCDNKGFCDIFKKGSSSNPIIWTIAKAVNDVADGLGIQFDVVKTARCSGDGEWASDKLSKGMEDLVRSCLPLAPSPVSLPLSLRKWIRSPVVRHDLGASILSDLSEHINVLPSTTENVSI